MARKETYWRAGHWVRRPAPKPKDNRLLWLVGGIVAAGVIFGGVQVTPSDGGHPSPSLSPAPAAVPSR